MKALLIATTAIIASLTAVSIVTIDQVSNLKDAVLDLAYRQAIVEQQEPSLGAFRPSRYTGKLLTRLQEGGAESTFNTTPATTPDGSLLTSGALGDFIVITINPGADNEEKISASAVSVSGSTATWTIINRGLSFASPTTTVTANVDQHAIGETVIISNDDQFLYNQYVSVDDTQTIGGQKIFTRGARFTVAASSTDECDSGTEYCTKAYVDATANAGAATSTETNGGIVELGTALEAASSTDHGSTKPTVLQTKNATSTPAYGCDGTSTVGALCGVIARNSGKIHQLWLDLTEHFIFTSLFATNASSTNATTTSLGITSGRFHINGINWRWPSTIVASSSILKTDASGNITSMRPDIQVLYNSASRVTGAGTLLSVTVPAATIPPAKLRITWVGSAASSQYLDLNVGNGSATTTLQSMYNNSGVFQTVYMNATTTASQDWWYASTTATSIQTLTKSTGYNSANNLYISASSSGAGGFVDSFVVELINN